MIGNNSSTDDVKGSASRPPSSSRPMASVVDTVGAGDSTQGSAAADARPPSVKEAEFFKTLARYQSSYKCMVEDMLKPGGGDNSSLEAEKKRLERFEDQLQSLTHQMTDKIASDSRITDQLKADLESSRNKLQAMRRRFQADKAAESVPSAAGPGPNAAGPNAMSTLENDEKKLTTCSGQMASSGAVARLYYTRLIFWAVLAIMLVIVLIHAANSTDTGFIINSVGIIVCLVMIYYVLRFVYRRVF